MTFHAVRPTHRDRLPPLLLLRNLVLCLPFLLLMLPVLTLAAILALLSSLSRLPQLLDKLLPPELNRHR